MFKVKDLFKKYPFSWSQLQYIFSSLFSEDIFRLYLENRHIDDSIVRRLNYVASLYSEGVPLEYILGKASFYGLSLRVNRSVLIPRPETEIMVEKVIDYLRNMSLSQFTVLDLGTGSGNISLALAEMASAEALIISSDISFSALEVAKENFAHYSCNNIYPLCANMFSAFKEKVFDIIVTNPPYVESTYLKKAPFLRHEPLLALQAGEDGLDFIRKIISQAGVFLKKKGRLFMEIGYNQAERVKKELECSHKLRLVETFFDYTGKERIIVAERIN